MDSTAPHADDNSLIAERRAKLAERRQRGGVVFPNDFKPEHRALPLAQQYGELPNEELEPQGVTVSVAGRMMLKRVMGKASFATVQDATGRIQLYVQRDALGDDLYADFKHWDLGDILAARDRFAQRSKAVAAMRGFMVEHGFLEVETPMLHPIPGGANAKPFVTHHNALDQEMFLRIAPELYLKRLIVGGFERVFEINRNFRNEGLSVRHNPEFTMMEFYSAFWDHHDLMDFTEALLRHVAVKAHGSAALTYNGQPVHLDQPFARLTIRDALLQHEGLSEAEADDPAALTARIQKAGEKVPSNANLAQLQYALFEAVVEEKLWQPTFIMNHPIEVSPLARANDANPGITDRFELYMTGREVANGFSELNDAEDQAARFQAQVDAKDGGDDEAMHFDADFVRALEIGMPPTGGCGIGIDRFVMLLTDSPSIRDVILFPALRRENV
ncbi:MAG: lysine--tRNA ligase [Inhella sp.]|uniref:lysine--tRNA ligase n=1 Tax=Inhella sp. TaxID=1921806 RepID=UPI00391D9906